MFREAIKRIRKQNGDRVGEFADRIGYSASRVSAMEHGRAVPKLHEVIYLCDTLHISPNELLDYDERRRCFRGLE